MKKIIIYATVLLLFSLTSCMTQRGCPEAYQGWRSYQKQDCGGYSSIRPSVARSGIPMSYTVKGIKNKQYK